MSSQTLVRPLCCTLGAHSFESAPKNLPRGDLAPQLCLWTCLAPSEAAYSWSSDDRKGEAHAGVAETLYEQSLSSGRALLHLRLLLPLRASSAYETRSHDALLPDVDESPTCSHHLARDLPFNPRSLKKAVLTQFTHRSQTIQETLAEIIPVRQALAKQIRADHGAKVLGEVTVEQVFGAFLLPLSPKLPC